MFNLIRRDLIIQKWQLLIFIPFILVFILTNSHPILTFLVSSIYIPFNAYYYDEKAETNILLNSLPYTRKQIIASRYLSAILYMLLSIVLVSLFLFIFGKTFTLTHIAIGSGLFILFAAFAFPLFYLLKQGHIFTIVLISFLVLVALGPSAADFLTDYMPMITNFIASLSTITLYTGLALGVAILYALSWGVSTVVYQRKAF